MSVKKLLLVAGVVLLGVALFFAGTSFAQSGGDDDDQGWSGMMGGREYGGMHEWANGSRDGAGFPDHMDGWDDHGAMHDAYGDMMGGWSQPEGDPDVTAEEAVTLAQAYLDEALPGATAEEHADAFPGYYTLHVLRNGEIEGMLSVNAYGGDVFPHTWHGAFVDMAEEYAE